MFKRPRLNLTRLRRDAAAASGAHREVLAPGGRKATGLMDAVRKDLNALVALQAGGLTWNAIATALSAQGLTTADGRAITGRNLTGVVSSIRRQARRAATRDAGRKARGDAVALSEVSAPTAPNAATFITPRPSLSGALVGEAATRSRTRPSEDERRIAALAAARSLLKKD